MTSKKILCAERIRFAGGETAIILRHGDTAFGTLIDECDNAIGHIFVNFASGLPEVEVFRMGASDSREFNNIVDSSPVHVHCRETAFVMPKSLASTVGGSWKFGDKFLRTVEVFSYAKYDD